MQITKQQVEYVANLARLHVTEAEQDAFAKQLSDILTYIEQLKAWDTTGVEPTATVLEQTNVFRDDQVRPSLSIDQALMNAPEADEGCFKVPRIIEER